MKDEIVPIVDEKDRIVGYKKRYELAETDIHRISVLWIENSKGQVLISKRSNLKKDCPGLWSAAVGGTVSKSETYETNIVKEAEEEIGLKDVLFKRSKKVFVKKKHPTFCQCFSTVIDKDVSEFVLDKKEVADLKWIDKKKLNEEFKSHPERFTPAFPLALEIFAK